MTWGLRIQRCTMLAVINITHTSTQTHTHSRDRWIFMEKSSTTVPASFRLLLPLIRQCHKCCCWMNAQHDCFIINTNLHKQMQRRNRRIHVYVYRKVHLELIETRLTFISKYRLIFVKVLTVTGDGSKWLVTEVAGCPKVVYCPFWQTKVTGSWVPLVYAVSSKWQTASLPLCHSQRRGRQRVKEDGKEIRIEERVSISRLGCCVRCL